MANWTVNPKGKKTNKQWRIVFPNGTSTDIKKGKPC